MKAVIGWPIIMLGLFVIVLSNDLTSSIGGVMLAFAGFASLFVD